VRTGERRGVCAAEEEEPLGAVSAQFSCQHGAHACRREVTGGEGETGEHVEDEDVREGAVGRDRDRVLVSKLRLTSESSFSSVNVCVASS
jgi:hypothetical protein